VKRLKRDTNQKENCDLFLLGAMSTVARWRGEQTSRAAEERRQKELGPNLFRWRRKKKAVFGLPGKAAPHLDIIYQRMHYILMLPFWVLIILEIWVLRFYHTCIFGSCFHF
jgi:hypothetical protein